MKTRMSDSNWIPGLLIFLLAVALIAGVIIMGIMNEINRITEGTIVDKQFVAEQSYYTGTKESAVYQHNPERHLFLLRGTKNGKTVEYWCEVSAEDFDRYRTGDYYKK